MLFVQLNMGIGPHQASLADAMFELLGKNFVFIEFGGKKLQYGAAKNITEGIDYYKDRPYILTLNESESNRRNAFELISKADAMRVGGEPLELTKDRLLAKKLTFRSTERLFKIPLWNKPDNYLSLHRSFYPFYNPNYRILCLSAFMANDMRYCLKSYKEKCYKFGYFTQIPQLDIEALIHNRRKDKLEIVWCARFIDWKHPEMPLLLAKKLIASGRPNFEIQMIGADTTELWHKTQEEIIRMHLSEHVKLTGGLPNTEVLKRMRESHVFIFTSDRCEGWGAVLNEAMGAGCACVASHEIGAVPFLLKNNENGLVFKSKSAESLFTKVALLYDNPALCEEYGEKAYNTITREWSAKTAAERLVLLSESILMGNEITFDAGPCSKAYPICAKSIL